MEKNFFIIVKVIFFQNSNFFSDLEHIRIFLPKITWKWHISKYSKSKMMDLQMGKSFMLAKFDKLKYQF